MRPFSYRTVTLHPSPFTLQPSPFTLHPSPFPCHLSLFLLNLSPDEFGKSIRRQRHAEVVTLVGIATCRPQKLQLGLGFHAFRNYTEAEGFRHDRDGEKPRPRCKCGR